MFLRYYVELPLPFDVVEQAYLAAPEAWVPALARATGDQAEGLLADVGFALGQHRLQQEVEVSFGDPLRFPSKTVLPLTWMPTRLEGLLPTLEADIEVGALGPRRTQLSISARYRPPLGTVGRAIDRALLHRVAEATVKDFLDRLAAVIVVSRQGDDSLASSTGPSPATQSSNRTPDGDPLQPL